MKKLKLFIFILLAFFAVNIISVNAEDVTGTVTVTVVAPPNTSPTANAGSDKAITLPTSSVSVTNASSSDSDGSIISNGWTVFSGPVIPTIASSTSLTPTFSDMTTAGTYTFKLTATDNNGAREQIL